MADVLKMLKCGVCLERYRAPKLLPCFHTFCQRCVEKVAGTKPSFTCPSCRTVTILPPGGAKYLQANFYIERDLAQDKSQPGQACDLCAEGKQATHKCVECQQVYCTPCHHTHDSIQSCASHTVLPMTADAEAKVSDERRCPKHKNQLLLLFCCQCEVSICMQCKLTSHDGHETEDVVDTGKKARAELMKELQTVTKHEQVLLAVLSMANDFEENLNKEKQEIEKGINARAKQMLAQAQKEAMGSVLNASEQAVNELKEQIVHVKERYAAVVAKRQHFSQIIDKGDDGEAVALLAQMKAERDQAQNAKPDKSRDEVMVERGTLCHEYKTRAVKFNDIVAFIGIAREGPVLETKATSMDVEALQESVKPKPSSDVQLNFRKHKISKGGSSSFSEIVYSRNPKSTLTGMHLMTSDDSLWLNFNPGGTVPLFALFDDEGQMMDVHSENIPTIPILITCEDDTVVSLSNGRWVRPGNESGGLQNFPAWGGNAVSKSSTPFLLKSSSIFRLLSTELPPKIDPNASWTINVAGPTFDVSVNEMYFATSDGSATVFVFDKLSSSTALRRYATYVHPEGFPVNDICFCFIDGKEMLLVAYNSKNTVHVVDHKDGCCFVRTLETDQCPLNAPFRLTTNHQGRVWVGCNGGKVIIFDV